MGFLDSAFSNPFKRDGDSNSGNFLDRATGLARSGGLSAGTDLVYDAKRGWSNGGGGGGGSVGEQYAALNREQWASYVRNFVPIENKLIEYATDPAVVDRAMTEASSDVTAAFDANEGAAERRLGTFGVTMTGDEKAASKRQFSLAKSLADVGAQNTARDLTRQRQQSIMGNPAPEAITI
jgi:hypothetical protein